MGSRKQTVVHRAWRHLEVKNQPEALPCTCTIEHGHPARKLQSHQRPTGGFCILASVLPQYAFCRQQFKFAFTATANTRYSRGGGAMQRLHERSYLRHGVDRRLDLRDAFGARSIVFVSVLMSVTNAATCCE